MSLEAADCLLVIEEWFAKQCDRLWENFYGVTIESTDNPGWLVVVSESTVHRLYVRAWQLQLTC